MDQIKIIDWIEIIDKVEIIIKIKITNKIGIINKIYITDLIEIIEINKSFLTYQTVSSVVIVHPVSSSWMFFGDSVHVVSVAAKIGARIDQMTILPNREKQEAVQAFELWSLLFLNEKI